MVKNFIDRIPHLTGVSRVVIHFIVANITLKDAPSRICFPHDTCKHEITTATVNAKRDINEPIGHTIMFVYQASVII